MHIASLNGHANVVEVLIASGIDVNTKDSMDRTPLHCASLNGDREVMKVLVAGGANINATDESDITSVCKFLCLNKVIILLFEGILMSNKTIL